MNLTEPTRARTRAGAWRNVKPELRLVQIADRRPPPECQVPLKDRLPWILCRIVRRGTPTTTLFASVKCYVPGMKARAFQYWLRGLVQRGLLARASNGGWRLGPKYVHPVVAAVYRCIPAPRGQVRYWQIVEATGLTPKQVSWAIRALRNQRLIRPYGRRNLKRTFGRKGYHAWTRRTAAAPAPKHLYGYPGLGKSCLALPIDPTLVVAEGVMARYAGALKELAR